MGNMQSFQEVLGKAPSVFANHAHQSRSDRYAYVPTIQLIEGLADHGWRPTDAQEQRVRDASRRGFAKHLVRLRNDSLAKVDGSFAELVITNSHDGSSAYQMRAGFYRLVCSNGLVVGDDVMPAIRIKHTGDAVREVIEGSYRVIDEVPALVGSIEEMSHIDLTDAERRLFAESAIKLRFDGRAPVDAGDALRPRRYADSKSDLWSTFNVVQENLVRGGIRGHDANGRRRTTREVKGIDGNIALNQALWTLAEGMKKLKAAA